VGVERSMVSRRTLEILGAALIVILLVSSFFKTSSVRILPWVGEGQLFQFEQLQPPSVMVPVIEPIGNRTLGRGEVLEIPIRVFDPRGQELELWTSWLPPWASFDPVNRTLRFFPPEDFEGSIPVTITAYNGWNFAVETIAITVPPVVSVSRYDTAEFQRVLDSLAEPPTTPATPPGAATAGRVFTVSPGESIAAAIDRASDGDTIMVREGIYHENLNIDKGIRLIGEGNPVINGSGKGSPVSLTIGGTTIDGFTLTGSGSGLYGSGIKVSSNRNSITNNIIRDNEDGIRFILQSESNVVSGNRIYNNTGSGISGEQLRNITLVSNAIINNSGSGVEILFSRNVEIGRNTIRYNQGSGLYLSYVTYAYLRTNTVANNRGGGIMALSGGRTVAEGNTIEENMGPGIYLFDSTDPLLNWNEIPLWGWSASERLNFLTGNVISRNSGSGIRVNLSHAIITGNTMKYNNHGLYLTESSCDLRENVADGNNYGLLILYCEGNVVSRNTLVRNNVGLILGDQSHHNRIIQNRVDENLVGGIMIFRDSDRNTVYENLATNNTDIGIANYGNNDLRDNIAIFNGRNVVV
jgi:nitrous oxidase accessory protein